MLILLLIGCGADSTNTAVPLPNPTGSEQAINQANLNYLRPFTVDHGTIACRAGKDALFITPDGHAYALNAQARADGYESVAVLRRGKVSLGAITSIALRLCRPAQ